MTKRANKTLSALTWAELEAWAGSRIVSRGKSYQKSGCVRDLARTSDGGLLAWVRGSRNFATKAALRAVATSLPLYLVGVSCFMA